MRYTIYNHETHTSATIEVSDTGEESVTLETVRVQDDVERLVLLLGEDHAQY